MTIWMGLQGIMLEIFSDLTPKAIDTKAEISKFNYVKITGFCTVKKPSTKYRQTLWMGEGTSKSHISHGVNIQNTSYMSSLCILGDTIKPTNQPSQKPARLLNFLLINIVFSLFKWTGVSTVCSQMHLFHKLPMGAVSCDQNHKNNQSTLTIQILFCFVFLFNQTIQPGFPTILPITPRVWLNDQTLADIPK